MTMTLVSTVTVGSGGAASIDFTSIPQTGTDLLVQLSLRDSGAIGMTFNADSGSNYYYVRLIGTGSAASSSNNSGAAYPYNYLPTGSTNSGDSASTFGNTSVYIPNYSVTVAKSCSVDSVTENNATNAYQLISANRWTGTAAITRVTLTPLSGTFDQYSTASLYTITKGSGGATVS